MLLNKNKWGHILRKEGMVEKIDLQREGNKASPYKG